ncbi:MAG: 4a-hydroxytetrahydrobiopterin dehydratase [Actinomycetota bacterium]|nr:4a-hydroxytetrahydrobiopterin dehydratase [Actinomycetota bacterium]
MTNLASEHPQEYPKGTPTLAEDDVRKMSGVVPDWEVRDGKLVRDFKARDFNEAFGFLARVALLAEAEGHHPDIHNSWNRVTLEFWTHTAEGLTRNDFIMAAKVNSLSGTSRA